MKLTIGMASYKNAAEVAFTVQALRLYHDLTDTEIVVVDNSADGWTEKVVAQLAPARYVRFTDVQGTAAAKNRVFAEARGEWVICIDSHVMLAPGSVARFREWAAAHPDCRDLLHGPLLYDDLRATADSWREEWSGSSFGLWNTAQVQAEADPYEIRLMGMGLFACRRDAWLGFHPDLRGFGGEERIIHQRFRNAGRKVLLLPWFRWWHYFHTRDGKSTAPHAPLAADVARNLRIGYQAEGLPLDELYAHVPGARPKVTNVQIDPNGRCGIGCWFCPVRYEPRPPVQVMPQPLFERVLDEILRGVELGSVAPNPTIWLCAYNDFLLDPLLEQRLAALRARKLKVPGITNGVGLLKHHRLLHDYRDVVQGYSVNVAAGNAEDYARHTNTTPETFQRVIDGLRALHALDPAHYSATIFVNVNGAHDAEWNRKQLRYPLPLGDTDRQVAQLRALLPGFAHVEAARPLADRAGKLAPHAIDNGIDRPQTSGCARLSEWVHVNSLGRAFTCCQDYDERHTFADLSTERLHEALASPARAAANRATIADLCRRCTFASER